MGVDQQSDSKHRVVPLPRRTGSAAPHRPVGEPPPVKDLREYERREQPDDYRHRMLVNIAAFVFLALLIAAGLWLADTMARMRKNQDCVLSGRSGCTPVDVRRDRW